VKYAIYEHAASRKFALIQLPDKFREGDEVPILPADRWFESHEDAVAALPELLDRES
jgi:hypothetical protein